MNCLSFVVSHVTFTPSFFFHLVVWHYLVMNVRDWKGWPWDWQLFYLPTSYHAVSQERLCISFWRYIVWHDVFIYYINIYLIFMKYWKHCDFLETVVLKGHENIFSSPFVTLYMLIFAWSYPVITKLFCAFLSLFILYLFFGYLRYLQVWFISSSSSSLPSKDYSLKPSSSFIYFKQVQGFGSSIFSSSNVFNHNSSLLCEQYIACYCSVFQLLFISHNSCTIFVVCILPLISDKSW